MSDAMSAPPPTLLDPVHLAAILGAEPVNTVAGSLPPGRGVAYDSRRVRPGDVFFALPGANGHGIEHADDALARGAAFIVSDLEHQRCLLVPDANAALLRLGAAARDRLSAPVIGITGSAGKTTTKSLITAALAARSTPGNLNTVPALVAALVEAALLDATTPDSTTPDAAGYGVNRSALVGSGAQGSPVVLELGIDRPGEMAELLSFCRPDHGVVTTIGESHLAALGDVAGVAREKSLLLAEAPGVRLAGAGAAEHLPAAVAARTKIVTVATDGAAADAEFVLAGRSLLHRGQTYVLPWAGRAMAENAALALSLALELGVDGAEAFGRMVDAGLEPGRLRRVDLGDIDLIDDSYNSNPLSAALAIEVLREARAPRVAILGDMRELGSVSRQRHCELGSATQGLDLVIAVGAEAAALPHGNPEAVWVPDAEGAIALLGRIPAGATVLVKGSRSLGLERVVAALEAR